MAKQNREHFVLVEGLDKKESDAVLKFISQLKGNRKSAKSKKRGIGVQSAHQSARRVMVTE